MRRVALVLALTATLLGGCTLSDDDDPYAGLEQQVASVSDDLFDAVGLREARVDLGFVRRAETSCAITKGIEAGLGEGEAWYGRGTYRLSPGDYDDERTWAQAQRHLAERGWELERYQGPGSLRALLAFKDGLGVRLDLPTLSVLVTGGPCGRETTVVGAQYSRQP